LVSQHAVFSDRPYLLFYQRKARPGGEAGPAARAST
jgi:hypothetical protein